MSKDIVEAKTLPGFMELLPGDQILFNQMMDTIKKSYEKFGFLPLDTPIIESAEVLLAKAGGETEKQIYRFNKGENDLALRFDLTVPLAKYIAQYYNELTFPFRRYQIGKVYRGEKPQKGRYREFYQCDIDIIGNEELSIKNDAELPSVIYTTFKELGFDSFVIRMNNRKILSGLFDSLNVSNLSIDIMRIIDKLDKVGPEKVIAEFEEIGLNPDMIEKIFSFISITGSSSEKIAKLKTLGITNETFNEGVNELETVLEYVKVFGVPSEFIDVDLKIARGLDYYTGTVYETFLTGYEKIGSICSGGRYDNLSQYYTDKKMPGVGISIGLTRLFYQLNLNNLIQAKKKSIADILIIPMDEDVDMCIEIAKELRNSGINTEIYLNPGNIKNKMKYANRLEIPYVIIIGENEKKTGLLTFKNMVTGEQENITVQQVISKL